MTIRRTLLVRGWLAVAGLLGAQAYAGVLYDNGPINAQRDNYGTSYYTQFGQQDADSFTLANNSVLTGVTFGAWVGQGDTPTFIDWSIVQVTDPGTDAVPFDYPNLYSGTGALSNTLFCSYPDPTCGGGNGWDIYTSAFSLPNISLPAGTYYLILTNGLSANGGGVGWDENDGPSDAWVHQPPSTVYHMSHPGHTALTPSSIHFFTVVLTRFSSPATSTL